MYTIKELSLMSGLTDRTLRNYLKLGFLKGEKKEGVWYFSVDQIESFFTQDVVVAAMESNRKALVFDFLANDKKDKNAACIILDLPEDDSGRVSSFFCDAVSKRNGLTMTFTKKKHRNRVILVGDEDTVYAVISEYHATKQTP